MARRLAVQPALFAVAAEQYLPVVDSVTDDGERSVAAALLSRAAEQAGLVGEYGQVHTMLSSALQLADPGDTPTLIQLHTRRLTALFCLGRLEEADEDYGIVDRLSTTALQRAEATCVQVRSLTNRKLYGDAIELAVTRCASTAPRFLRPNGFRSYSSAISPICIGGWTIPMTPMTSAGLKSPIRQRLPSLACSTRSFPPPPSPATYSCKRGRAWRHCRFGSTRAPRADSLVRQAIRQRRPSRCAMTMAPHTAPHAASWPWAKPAAMSPRPHWRGSYRPISSAGFEPLEVSVGQAKRACDGLMQGGDLATAGYTVAHTYGGRLDFVPTLDIYAAEAETAFPCAEWASNRWGSGCRPTSGLQMCCERNR